MTSLLMTNKEYQLLGKVPRVLKVFLLDDEKNRVRELLVGSEEHSRYSKEDLEILVKKPLKKSEVLLDIGECLF